MPPLSPPPSPSPPAHTATSTTTAISTPRPTLHVFTPLPVADDGAATDPELERRWASVRRRLSAVLHDVRLRHSAVRTDPADWVGVYSDFAYLYTNNDERRKRRVYVYVRDFVRELVAAQLHYLRTLHGPLLLVEYVNTWKASMRFVSFMKRVLHHLHRYWIRANANTLKDDPVRPLDRLLMFYWREDLLSKLPAVVDMALTLVDKDRKGEKIDYEVVRGVVDTLVEIGAADLPVPNPDTEEEDDDHDACLEASDALKSLHLYIHVFEEDFLTLTRTFYRAEGASMVAGGDVTRFMKDVLARLEDEAERGRRLLHPKSGPRLQKVVEEELIGMHTDFLQRAASDMIKAGRESDLRLVYLLLCRVENGLSPLRSFFVSFVRREGNAVVVEHVDKLAGKDDMNSNLSLVRVLIRLHRTYASLVKRCFDGSSVIMVAIDDAFRGFANRSLGPVSLPILLAHYIDQFLRHEAYDREMWHIERDVVEGTETTVADDPGSEARPTAEAHNLLVSGAIWPREGQESKLEQTRKRMRAESGVYSSAAGSSGSAPDDSGRREDELISQYVGELVRLFMYLEDKDMFFETHRRLFAKRLLGQHDEVREQLFIDQVKVQMGPSYVQRLSGMLKDKLLSNEMRSRFEAHLEKKREELRSQLSRKTLTREDSTDVASVHPNDAGADDGNLNGRFGNDATANSRDPSTGLERNGTGEEAVSSVSDGAAAVGATEGQDVQLGTTADKGRDGVSCTETVANKGNEEEACTTTAQLSSDELTAALRIDFNTHVLNALHWPAIKGAELRIPRVLEACQQLFTEFYMRDKQTRKLSWVHSLSTVHLAARFGSKRYTFVVSASQASALMLFNECDQLSVGEACKLLNVERTDLCQHIMPMIAGKRSRILRLEKRDSEAEDAPDVPMDGLAGSVDGTTSELEMDPSQNTSSTAPHLATDDTGVPTESKDANDELQRDGPAQSSSTAADLSAKSRRVAEKPSTFVDPADVKDTDIIHINASYASRLRRVVVPATVAKLTSAEKAASKRNVVVDRSTQMDATLVRIMKAAKQITFADLSARVIEALAPMFLPDPRLIKTRLERLIDQEYVERDAQDARLYRYSA